MHKQEKKGFEETLCSLPTDNSEVKSTHNFPYVVHVWSTDKSGEVLFSFTRAYKSNLDAYLIYWFIANFIGISHVQVHATVHECTSAINNLILSTQTR